MYEFDVNLVSKEGEQLWEYVIYKKIKVSDKQYSSLREVHHAAENECIELEKLIQEL